MLKIKLGNLVEDATEDYLVHQCNTTTSTAKGLAATIFKHHPHANSYQRIMDKRIPGTIDVYHPMVSAQPGVINLYAQLGPGRPYRNNSRYYDTCRADDTASNREKWFEKGLEAISNIPELKSVAFPWKIGCGLAGGDWDRYMDMLLVFAKKNPMIEVTVYRLSLN